MEPNKLLIVVLVAIIHSATPCGILTHQDIGARAAAFFGAVSKDGVDYAQLIEKHQDAFQGATSFPDAFYPGICSGGDYHQVSEDTHWTPFLEAGVKYIRDTYPPPWSQRAEKLVVFLLGIVQHQVSDVTWHNLGQGIKEGFLDVMGKTNFHGSFNKAHTHGDFGGDVVNVVELNTDFVAKIGTWYIPVDDLAGIYRVLYNNEEKIPNDVIVNCNRLMFLGRLGEKIGAINLLYPYYAMKSPFLLDRVQDYFLGGMDDMAAWTGHVWESTALMLDQGTQVCDLPGNPVFIRCQDARLRHLAGNGSTVAQPHQRTGWHHHDTLQAMIGDLSIDEVITQEVDGAVLIRASERLKRLAMKAVNDALSMPDTLPQTALPGPGVYAEEETDEEGGSSIVDKIRGALQKLKPIIDFIRGGKEEALPPTATSGTLLSDKPEDWYSRLGESLLSFDLNADGFDDLVVGAPVFGKRGNPMAGRVYIMYGTEEGIVPDDVSVSEKADIVLEAVEPNGRFGSALAAVDMNADGHMDLAISAPMEGSQNLEYTGAVYIYYGQEDGTLSQTHGMKLTCTKFHCNMGWSLAGNDLNGDGIRDLLIGCPFASTGGSQRGMVGAFHGKKSFKYVDTLSDKEFEWEWYGEQDWAWLGYSVASAGNVVAIGAPQQRICALDGCQINSEDTQAAGQVFVFKLPLSRTPAATLAGSENFGQYGDALAISDDGKMLAVGAMSENQGSLIPVRGRWQEGRVYLYDMAGAFLLRLLKRPSATLKGVKMLSRFGQTITIADVNADDIDDVIVGAPLYNGDVWSSAQEGRVYVFNGKDGSKAVNGIKSSKADDADRTILLAEGRSRFGSAIAPLHTKGGKVSLAISSMHSNEGSRLGGKVSFFTME